MQFGLDNDQYRLFYRDALYGSIPVGGICKNACIFCSTQVSKKTLGINSFTNYITKDEFESILPIVDWERRKISDPDAGWVQLGNGIGILTCEPFFHPDYIYFIKRLHSFWPQFNLFTGTVGKWIDPAWYDVFKNNNMNFYVSINSFDSEMRSELMKSKDDINGMINFLKECKSQIYKTSFVYHGDLDKFKKDIEYLLKIDNGYIEIPMRLWLPEYSDYSSTISKELYHKATKTWIEANEWLKNMIKCPQPAVTSLNENLFPKEIFKEVTFLQDNFSNRINHSIKEMVKRGYEPDQVGFLLSESVFDYAKKWPFIEKINIKNTTFGGSIKVASLLTYNDFYNAINNHHKKYDMYVASQETFRYFDNDLSGNHPNKLGLNLILS